ncbi:hypothetical protein SERLA73DRAFT_187733 [Serpula lacrymans var. lacrymans S7.3]|uniref:Methyltransferase domain-containing protein n=2 Tax=Serpula lacrymans var. lacrymans TaxID=341189 RepID=F8QA91_SERL3|nr:uncharacterized protein SERLADRAFT_477505 [Serpula lacrymans var. lacrymans S7.9]EGN94681.1 hypothetical protein SERLA73DRAFT_187733 [Serpula lacrymans var. lacrymans S7.3]EGO20163.1 hypothetical protein SERLADRAFT_477505 [Serpula lacrymans var. lacrymans S7.9]
MEQSSSAYVHDHHESVLRSHSWRTAANSAAYLLPSLKPDMHILDVGCGPGTITIDLAKLVPQGHVTGIEPVPDVLDQARTTASTLGVQNVLFKVGDVHALDYPDATFDVVHAHQVLQHVVDPVMALKEMRRVTKPGGIIAVRSIDFEAMTWYPEVDGMKDWLNLHIKVARSLGGEPNAGRMLLSWARQAGIDQACVKATAGTWCYSTSEERAWWSSLWADRIVKSAFSRNALESGQATEDDLARMGQDFTTWGASPDGWFAVMHGEILCHI